MNILLSIYLFLIGTAFGSFALAMVDRMRAKKDWVKGRSECDSCKHVLQPKDLVPLLSWLSTKGRCRYCKTKLSASYPVAEMFVGLAFVFSFIYWPTELNNIFSIAMFVVWLSAVVIMTGLFIFDMRWFLLPNKLVMPLIGLGAVWAILDVFSEGLSFWIVVNYLLAIGVGAGVFLLLYAVSKGRWIGDGDIRLGIAIGLFTGSPLGAWFSIFLASAIGIIVSIPLIVKTKKKNRLKLKIPYGPLLITSLYLTVLFGEQVLSWYKTNILFL